MRHPQAAQCSPQAAEVGRAIAINAIRLFAVAFNQLDRRAGFEQYFAVTDRCLEANRSGRGPRSGKKWDTQNARLDPRN